jgi:hypothetical protein
MISSFRGLIVSEVSTLSVSSKAVNGVVVDGLARRRDGEESTPGL